MTHEDSRTREEHIKWCKTRAVQYLDAGDWNNAWASMASDLSKHPETKDHSGLMLGTLQLMGGMLSSVSEMRRFIEGFN